VSVAEFGWFLFSTGGAICAVALAGGWLALRPGSRHARRALVAVLAAYALAASHVVGSQLTSLAGAGFDPLTPRMIPPGRTAVVVLGSGGLTARGWDDAAYSMLDAWGALRALEAARVFALAEADWVVPAGGFGGGTRGPQATGLIMRDTLLALGVPTERIAEPTRSRNTREEAVAAALLLPTLGVDRVVLVTSRVHMRRALGAFRAAGIDAIPAPARDRRTQPDGLWRVLPTDAGLYETAVAAHEAAGLLYYWLRGWYRPHA
jgi:uncharacterized SAM-binding protein YcdF (DUF218 family)